MLKRLFGARSATRTTAGPARSAGAKNGDSPTSSSDTFVHSTPATDKGLSDTAARRLSKEFRALAKLVAAQELTGYGELVCVSDDLSQWSVRLHLDEGSLAQDLVAYGKRHGQDYMQLRLNFPNDYPHQPPMVWVQSPVLAYRSGFVSRGAICNEMLVTTGGDHGWRAAYQLEAVLTTVRANLQDPAAGGRIHNLARPSSYSQTEASAGLARARQQHSRGGFIESAPPSAAADRAAVPAGFPVQIESLTEVASLRGVTAPRLLSDAAGKRFVAKQDPVGTPGLIDNEFHVLKAYEALGVKVPQAHMYGTGAHRTLLNAFIEGTQLGCLTGSSRLQAEGRVRRGFVADALLGAWDAVGASGDNIIVDSHSEAWRVDNGCGYDRRARGGTKTAAQFGAELGELATLRTVKDRFSEVRHGILSAVTDADIRSQRDAIREKKDALFAVVPAKHRRVMEARWAALMRW